MPLEEVRGSARAAMIALYGWMAVQAAILFGGIDYLAGDGTNVWFATPDVIGLLQLIGFATTVITAIFVLTWMYRAMESAHRRVPALLISPAGAVGWFFVPIANLWKPYEAMVEIVQGNGPGGGGRSRHRDMVMWWWLAWLGRSCVGLFQQFAERGRFVVLYMVAAILGIGAGIALQVIIQGVEQGRSRWVDADIFA